MVSFYDYFYHNPSGFGFRVQKRKNEMNSGLDSKNKSLTRGLFVKLIDKISFGADV